MTITPQSIRDKEFRIKLRGYDQTEVKELLDLVAEEFLQCLERQGRLERNIEILRQKNSGLRQSENTWKKNVAEFKKTVQTVTDRYRQESEKLNKLHTVISQLKDEKQSALQQLSGADTRLKEMKSGVAKDRSVQNGLLQRISSLEKRNEQLKDENSLLKEKLAAGKTPSEITAQENEQQVKEELNKARREIEKVRNETRQELASFPAEINRMKEEYEAVKARLRAIVKEYLENLESNLKLGNKLLDKEPPLSRANRQEDGRLAKNKEGIDNRKQVKGSRRNNSSSRKRYSVIEGFEDGDNLFQSIPIPDEMPLDSDYLDEISKSLFLPTD